MAGCSGRFPQLAHPCGMRVHHSKQPRCSRLALEPAQPFESRIPRMDDQLTPSRPGGPERRALRLDRATRVGAAQRHAKAVGGRLPSCVIYAIP
jgi:hypothetical protein